MKSTPSIGSWITVCHPTIVEVMAAMPFDWLCVDLEHSPVSRLELQTSLSIIQGRGKKAFVRVAENSHTAIKFPLDAGVDGIIVPMVNSYKAAKEALNSCLYPPLGNRGVGLARAQAYGFGFEDHLQKNKSNLEIFFQIEHIDAVNEINEIMKLERLNGVFLGPYDLSGSMGIPGQFDDPKFVEAVRHVAAAAKNAGKVQGVHVIKPDSNELNRYVGMGYNFTAFSIDTFFLGQKLREEFAKLGRTF